MTKNATTPPAMPPAALPPSPSAPPPPVPATSPATSPLASRSWYEEMSPSTSSSDFIEKLGDCRLERFNHFRIRVECIGLYTLQLRLELQNKYLSTPRFGIACVVAPAEHASTAELHVLLSASAR